MGKVILIVIIISLLGTWYISDLSYEQQQAYIEFGRQEIRDSIIKTKVESFVNHSEL